MWLWPRGVGAVRVDDDRVTHLGVGRNLALCTKVGETTAADVWGHWLTKDAEDVDCPRCVSWMHA